MDYDLDNCPRSAHALRNRISSSGNAGRALSIETDAVIIKVDVDNNDVEKYRRLVGILDLESEGNVARRVSSREAAANQVQIYNASGNQVATTQIDNHILWNTRRRDEVTGYYTYKFRHYSAELGRWLARDPIEESDEDFNYEV